MILQPPVHSTAPGVLGLSAGVDSLFLAHHLQQASIPHVAVHVHHDRDAIEQRQRTFLQQWAADHSCPLVCWDLPDLQRFHAHLQSLGPSLTPYSSDLTTTSQFLSPILSPLTPASHPTLSDAQWSTWFHTFFSQKGMQSHSSSPEAHDRFYRYLALQATAFSLQSPWIALGHHQQDDQETRLLSYLRGQGLQSLLGLSSMAPIASPLTPLWRPLLNTPKTSLIAWMTEHHHPWIEDPSNQDPRFRRNFLRHTVLPSLQTHFHQFFQPRTLESELSDLLAWRAAHLERLCEQLHLPRPTSSYYDDWKRQGHRQPDYAHWFHCFWTHIKPHHAVWQTLPSHDQTQLLTHLLHQHHMPHKGLQLDRWIQNLNDRITQMTTSPSPLSKPPKHSP